MDDLPTGPVTFLFTDIEGSTRLVQQLGTDGYQRLLGEHSALLRAAVQDYGGREFGSEGDAHFFVFRRSGAALQAATAAQRALADHAWPEDSVMRVRMGIHAGTPARHGDNYVGVDLNRVARITSAGHGGQILVSDIARQSATAEGGEPPTLTDLGLHRLKDLAEPEHIFQLLAPGLADEFPPIRTIDTRPHQLPSQLTSFVGRARDLAEIGDLAGRARLVTLTGPGGSGKTRLAIAAADRLLPRFDDGVFFVPLASIDAANRVAPTIGGVLGVREVPDRESADVLSDHLRDKRLLLVIDNFEQVMPAAGLIGRLLEVAPALSIIVTSRELLRIYGEQEYEVKPLPVPMSGMESQDVAANACVRLFVERAAAVRPDFRLTDENLRIVAEICRRVDGLPLTVELAAARIRILSPNEVLARLDRLLSGLTGGARDLPDRQRTLRATIDWSHELLAPAERRLFARLSAFAGGWTLDAAEAICADDLGLEVLTGLESLVDKSLVRREMIHPDELRFSMLETIREYARERLDAAGEAPAVQRRHAGFFRLLAETPEDRLTGPDADRWLDLLGHETDNIRAALRWALESNDPVDLETGLFTAGGLWRFWQQVGALREAAEWLERLLVLAPAEGLEAARAKALRGAGGIAYWQGDLTQSRRLYEESVALYRQLDDPAGLARALSDLAYLPMVAGEMETARELFAEARDLFRQQGAAWDVALAEFNLGGTFYFAGDYATARQYLDAALPVIRERGDRFWLLEAVMTGAQIDRMTGRYDAARVQYLESLEDALNAGILASVAMVLDPLANLESAAGDHGRAVTLWAASQAIKQRVGGGAPPETMQVVDPRPLAVEAIGAEAVERAWAAGQAMSVEQAAAYAREPGSRPVAEPVAGA